jgi:DNA-binding PadR family transcriptional regulator
MTVANHHERQLMQRLRGAGWVNASALPSSPGLVQKLLQKGWIETKSGPKTEVLYRLTEEGLEAKKLPIPIPERRRPSSKGKISD